MNLLRSTFGIDIALDSGERLPIRQIMAVGRNYAEHAHEQGADVPDRPMIFSKNIASLALNGDDIIIPEPCKDREQVDYEGELAVVIGRAARDIPEPRALDPFEAGGVILGYAIANDVSARWWQKQGAGGQFFRGKSFDTFCPIGPRITPASLIADPQRLTLTTRLNGETVQSDTTASMIFPVAHLIAELSRGATLLPGTLILTGTPSGVGMARNPQRFLRDGDTVEITIGSADRPDLLGTLNNTVRSAPRP